MESIKNLNEVQSFNDFHIKESFRAHMIYEEITKETFKPTNLKSIIIYFYSCVMAANRELPADFEVFVDWLDDNPDYLNEFVEWYRSTLMKGVVKNEQPAGEEAGEEKPFQHE